MDTEPDADPVFDADPVLDALAAAVGDPARVRPAQAGDRLPGGLPRYVARPSSTEDTSAVLRAAAAHGLRMVVRGTGTRMGWTAPGEPAELVLDSTGLDRIVDHAAADLVLVAQAGVPLAAVQQRCASAGQMLALDPIGSDGPTGTLGGIVATNASGPYRMRYGTCRDLLIGVTAVLVDGTVARSGGRVVKNVAGYDLAKLYTGSFGTLGVLTELVFRLHPRPVDRVVLVARYAGPAQACAAAQAVRRGQLGVSALELHWSELDGPVTVAALVEDSTGTGDRVTGLTAALAAAGPLGPPAHRDSPPSWWGRVPWPTGGYGIRVAVRLSRLPPVLAAIGRRAAGLPVTVTGSLGAGVLYLGLSGPVEATAVTGLVTGLRADLPPDDGSVVVLDRPVSGVHSSEPGLDRWGPVAGLALMRRVKAQFDPQRRLAPGRFVGGI